jgi:hypothetical protein
MCGGQAWCRENNALLHGKTQYYLLMLRKKQKGLSFPHVPSYGIPYSGIFSGNPEELDTR